MSSSELFWRNAPSDQPAFERIWIPSDAGIGTLIFRYRQNSPTEKAFLADLPASLAIKTGGNLAAVAQLFEISALKAGKQKLSVPKTPAAMAVRGTGYFDGNYGFLCHNSQKFQVKCILVSEVDGISWDSFGLCPHWSAWEADPHCRG